MESTAWLRLGKIDGHGIKTGEGIVGGLDNCNRLEKGHGHS